MTRAALVAAAVAVSTLAGPARGDEPDGPPPVETTPAYSADPAWAGPMLIGIAGLFAAAAVVGPLVWLRMRDVVPAAATHEEDPAADRH